MARGRRARDLPSGGPVEAAYREGLRRLGRRPLSEAELSALLRERGHGAEASAAALARLREHGYLDDAALALHAILVRTERLGHAPRRVLRELRARGVAAAVAREALRRAEQEHGLDAPGILRREIARRLGERAGKRSAGEVRRVYNALLRAGFQAREVKATLEPWLRDSAAPEARAWLAALEPDADDETDE